MTRGRTRQSPKISRRYPQIPLKSLIHRHFNPGDLVEGHWGMRNFSRHGSIDHTICSLSCKL